MARNERRSTHAKLANPVVFHPMLWVGQDAQNHVGVNLVDLMERYELFFRRQQPMGASQDSLHGSHQFIVPVTQKVVKDNKSWRFRNLLDQVLSGSDEREDQWGAAFDKVGDQTLVKPGIKQLVGFPHLVESQLGGEDLDIKGRQRGVGYCDNDGAFANLIRVWPK
jgi:hypothetical protein